MAKYKLTQNGVQNRDTGAFIPNSPGNRHWIEYQEWLSEGNTPDPEFTNEQLKGNKKNNINSEREVRLENGIVDYMGNNFSTDSRTRANLSGVVAYLSTGNPLPPGFTWRSEDNQDVSMNSSELSGLSATIVNYVNNVYATSWSLKAQVDALDVNSPTFETDLNNIDWP